MGATGHDTNVFQNKKALPHTHTHIYTHTHIIPGSSQREAIAPAMF